MTVMAQRAPQNTHLKTCILENSQHKPTLQDQPHISYSQLKSYAGCSLAWRLSRTHRPEHISAALLFGSAFHAAAESLYQRRLEGATATHQDLMAAYDGAWAKHFDTGDGQEPIPVRYPAKSDAPSLRETASRMLEAFLLYTQQHMGEVIAVEEPFEIELAPDLPALKGRIDLIEVQTDESGNKRLCLIDFKTTARRMDEDAIDYDQLSLYAMAMEKTGLLGQIGLPLALGVTAVTKTKSPEMIVLSTKQDHAREKRVIARARQIWKSMSAGICYPCPGWLCSGCGYASLCGKWPDIADV